MKKDLIDLFKVELDYSSLKEYLHEVTLTINQQADSIHSLQQQVKSFLPTQTVYSES
jgi:hypothetical protein